MVDKGEVPTPTTRSASEVKGKYVEEATPNSPSKVTIPQDMVQVLNCFLAKIQQCGQTKKAISPSSRC